MFKIKVVIQGLHTVIYGYGECPTFSVQMLLQQEKPSCSVNVKLAKWDTQLHWLHCIWIMQQLLCLIRFYALIALFSVNIYIIYCACFHRSDTMHTFRDLQEQTHKAHTGGTRTTPPLVLVLIFKNKQLKRDRDFTAVWWSLDISQISSDSPLVCPYLNSNRTWPVLQRHTRPQLCFRVGVTMIHCAH